MIERYTTKEMKAIWSDEHKYEVWLKVELAVLDAYQKRNLIPRDDYLKIKTNAFIKPKRIQELEASLHHDVIAFTRQISETLGEEKKWVHYGLTSTDIVDSGNGYLLKEANLLIEEALITFIEVIKEKALRYKNTPAIGRTHGIHAEITSFGLKWAQFYDEGRRNLARFQLVRDEIEVGKLSGAVGNFANIDPDIEVEVCKALGINNALISTQVLSRDRHLNYFNTLALIASFLEKIATEVRHLSRTEVGEVEEYFSKGQKGSSAMPHKKNPIASENICGLSRIVRSFALAASENNILWHERDISHSSAERIMFVEATTLLHYMLIRYTGVIKNLVINLEKVETNIKLTNKIIFSGRVVSLLIDKGLSREESYDFIQKQALIATNSQLDFQELISKSEISKILSQTEIDSCFAYDYYLKNIDKIYERLKIGAKYE
ncbi:MAG: adenylosuccinate lyase [Bacilli bacterium]|nr:adenylosuccinate lyase [Bacilli bacterium]